MGRAIVLSDRGTLEFKEAKASGTHGVKLQAPASVAAGIALTLPGTLPAGTEFLTLDASGVVGLSAGSTASLDAAYDAGGSGAGRIVIGDNGPLEVQGAGGFLASHSAPVYGLETTGAGEYNWRLTASQDPDTLEIQRGNEDADYSDDTFVSMISLDGANRRVGINETDPDTALEVKSDSGRCQLKVSAAGATSDASILFTNSTTRFEVGYDDSAGGLVIGRISFTAPTLFVEDTTGDVGINEVTPDAKLHVTSAENLVAVFESTEGVSGVGSIALLDKDTTDNTKVRLSAVGDNMRAEADAFTLLGNGGAITVLSAGIGIGTAFFSPGARCEIRNPSSTSATALLVNQDDAGSEGIIIDSEATSQPLLQFAPLTGNSRGDINFSGRTADASSSAAGDLWYASSRLKINAGGTAVRTIGCILGPNHGDAAIATIDGAGAVSAVTAQSGVVILAANSGTTDNLDDIAVPGSGVEEGDTLILRADAGDTITVRHNGGGTGNIRLDGSANKALNGGDQFMVIWDGTNWRQLTPLMNLP